MTGLYLLREEVVPVEQLRAGEKLILPGGRRVIVERVDEYDDVLVVRWWRRAEIGEPGHRGLRANSDLWGDANDGRYLGSLVPKKRGETVKVDRG